MNMRISGAGCCLLDSLYNNFDINSKSIEPLLSKENGDGGIKEGGLVFFESLQQYSSLSSNSLKTLLTNDQEPNAVNLGGPAIVAMVNIAQMLEKTDVHVCFEGVSVKDKEGLNILEILDRTPLDCTFKAKEKGSTPKTIVLSGKNERTFVNELGIAKEMKTSDLSDEFYKSDIVLLGGTALVPNLHNNLSDILKKVKDNGGLTVVGTVYDYKNEQENPDKPWPLVNEDSWKYIDILVMDAEEALRISGTEDLLQAGEFFKGKVNSFIITHGSKDIIVWAGGNGFKPLPITHLPVSEYIDLLLKENPSLKHDSTGCGDNFAGGVVVSAANQLLDAKRPLDIIDCCVWGASCGGFTLLYDGGTYIENETGEKLEKVSTIVCEYKKQLEKKNVSINE